MLEDTAVGVPADPEAMATAIKEGKFECVAKDFDIEIEEEIKEIEEEVFPEIKGDTVTTPLFNIQNKRFALKTQFELQGAVVMTPSDRIGLAVKENFKFRKGVVY